MALSTLIHAALIVVLALTFAVEAKRVPVKLTLGMDSEPAVEESSVLTIVAADPASLEALQSPMDVSTEALPAIEAIAPVLAPVLELDDPPEMIAGDVPFAPFSTDELVAPRRGGSNSPDQPRSAGGERGGHRGPDHGGAGQRMAGAGAAGAGTFFGRSGQGRSVCFLCDNSNSHSNGGFHVVLEEVARAVEALPADQKFYVIFFSDAAYPLFHPEPATTLVAATRDNKMKLRSWLGTVEMCRGGQGIHEAVRLAGSLDADAIYLLSDGQLSAGTVDRVTTADFGDAVVHTFGIQQPILDRRAGQVAPDTFLDQQSWNHNLVTIAKSHGGVFSPVYIPPTATVLERMRPIPRNRVRGAVWGLRL